MFLAYRAVDELIPYTLKFSCGLIFTVFVDRKPSAKVLTCKNLDWALVQWQNMAVREY